MSKEIPILFSTPMVQAILDDRKTMTRRIVKPQPDNPSTFGVSPIWGMGVPNIHPNHFCIHAATNVDGKRVDKWITCPYGKPGDILWVRESWSRYKSGEIVFKADKTDATIIGDPWKPSVHMPKAAARIWLEVTDVKVERLQDISRGDAMAEGCPFPNMADGPNPRQWFGELWNGINGGDGWENNPYVWVISFKVLSKTGKP